MEILTAGVGGVGGERELELGSVKCMVLKLDK